MKELKRNIFFYYKKLIQIRVLEESIAEDFKKNKIFSFFHSSSGQEGSAIGACAALKKNDFVIGNHRSHGHYIAKNGDIKKLIYEIYGDHRGCCNGIGGSMHLKDMSVGFVGSTPILGSVAPIACGIAASKKFLKKKNIVVAFIGDGAAEEGAFYESINLAGLFNLPIIFIIEDNALSVLSTSKFRKAKGYSHKHIFSSGLNAYYERVDGQDVVKVYKKCQDLKKKVLKFKKPAILHLDVIRKYAHSGSGLTDNKNFKKIYNVNSFDKKDCLLILENYMKKWGIAKNKILAIKNQHVEFNINLFNKLRATINPRGSF